MGCCLCLGIMMHQKLKKQRQSEHNILNAQKEIKLSIVKSPRITHYISDENGENSEENEDNEGTNSMNLNGTHSTGITSGNIVDDDMIIDDDEHQYRRTIGAMSDDED